MLSQQKLLAYKVTDNLKLNYLFSFCRRRIFLVNLHTNKTVIILQIIHQKCKAKVVAIQNWYSPYKIQPYTIISWHIIMAFANFLIECLPHCNTMQIRFFQISSAFSKYYCIEIVYWFQNCSHLIYCEKDLFYC